LLFDICVRFVHRVRYWHLPKRQKKRMNSCTLQERSHIGRPKEAPMKFEEALKLANEIRAENPNLANQLSEEELARVIERLDRPKSLKEAIKRGLKEGVEKGMNKRNK
jgi:hypothetical protein